MGWGNAAPPRIISTPMLILFDAAGTLIELAEPVEAVYARHFVAPGAVIDAAILRHAFHEGFRTIPEPEFAAGSDGEAIERGWWRKVVAHVASAAGWEAEGPTFEIAFDRLFDHYAKASAWRAFPETEEILGILRAGGARLAVVSNFDRRLHRVLGELDLARHFDAVLTSADVGARKPSPLLIHEAAARLRRGSEPVCLVGDSAREDGGAAAAAGVPVFLVERPHRTPRDLAAWLAATFPRKSAC